MTGVLLGLLLGVGLFLVWWSCWVPSERPAPRAQRPGPFDRLSDEIVQAGFAGLSVRTLLGSSVLASLLVLAIVQATVILALLAADSPSLQRRRVTARQSETGGP